MSPSTRRPTSRPLLAAALAAGLTAGLVSAAPSAAAAPVVRESTTDLYDTEVWACGYRIAVHGVLSAKSRTRTDRATGLGLWSGTERGTETWSVPGRDPVTVSWNQSAKDVRLRPLGGTLFEGTFQIAGRPLTVRDARGTVISTDSGNITYTRVLDTATGILETTGITIAGPHPGYFADLCDIVEPYLGTDSASRLRPFPIGSPEAAAAGLGFYEYLPTTYDVDGEPAPLLVTLNGYGENGDGTPEALGRLLETGIPRFIGVGGWPSDRPFVVLAPQHVPSPEGLPDIECPEYRGGSCYLAQEHDLGNPPGSSCTTPDEVHAFLQYAVSHYNVDPRRIYLTGLSCGGFAIWEYVARYGDELVAAAVPVAGEGRAAFDAAGCVLAAVPMWAIHSADDDWVDPAGSTAPIAALRSQCGATEDSARLSLYPGLLHGGWDEAYSGALGDDIYAWLLDHPAA
jgi:dienelactone hydrolase